MSRIETGIVSYTLSGDYFATVGADFDTEAVDDAILAELNRMLPTGIEVERNGTVFADEDRADEARAHRLGRAAETHRHRPDPRGPRPLSRHGRSGRAVTVSRLTTSYAASAARRVSARSTTGSGYVVGVPLGHPAPHVVAVRIELLPLQLRD